MLGRTLLVLLFALTVAGNCAAESACGSVADVKYRGPVDLSRFSCNSIERSSFIRCVCYDRANAYMIIKLNETFYHYCGIDNETVSSLLAAGSMGRFYNGSIKGHFDCRTGRVPPY
jgi:hypothetical protein